MILSSGIDSKSQTVNPISSPRPASPPVINPIQSSAPAIPTNPLPMPSVFPGCTLSSSIIDLPPKTNYICGGFCGINMNIPCQFQNGICGDNCPRSLIDELWPQESPSPFNPYDHINYIDPASSPPPISY